MPNQKYELIDRHGNVTRVFDSAQQAAQFAIQFWPDQEQDETRSGKGWDVRKVGVEG